MFAYVSHEVFHKICNAFPEINVWSIKIRTTRNMSLWLYEYFWIILLNGHLVVYFKGLGMRNLQYEMRVWQKSHNKVTKTVYVWFEFLWIRRYVYVWHSTLWVIWNKKDKLETKDYLSMKKGSCNNYVDIILPFFEPSPLRMAIFWISSPSSCPLSYWMTPLLNSWNFQQKYF